MSVVFNKSKNYHQQHGTEYFFFKPVATKKKDELFFVQRQNKIEEKKKDRLLGHRFLLSVVWIVTLSFNTI